MAKGSARKPESFANEKIVHELAASLLEASGFLQVTTAKRGSMKILRAKRQDGTPVTFWLKQGWSTTPVYAAMQFGMFKGRDGASIEDQESLASARHIVDSSIAAGATHALLVHLAEGELRHWAALPVEELYGAYAAQLKGWPKRARNTKSPTLWFVDDRAMPDSACISAVQQRTIALEDIAMSGPRGDADLSDETADRRATFIRREVLARLRQRQFRAAVGERFGWTCAVSGCAVKEVLEAAHLPGRNWRLHNAVADGVLLRSDLHRLLDAGLATFEVGLFRLSPSLRRSPYWEFDGHAVR